MARSAWSQISRAQAYRRRAAQARARDRATFLLFFFLLLAVVAAGWLALVRTH